MRARAASSQRQRVSASGPNPRSSVGLRLLEDLADEAGDDGGERVDADPWLGERAGDEAGR